MDTLIEQAKKLAEREEQSYLVPVKNRVIFLVDTDESLDFEGSLAEENIELIALVRPGYPWDISKNSDVVIETKEKNVRYIRTSWGVNEPENEGETFEQVTRLLIEQFRVFRPNTVVISSAYSFPLSVYTAVKKLSIPFANEFLSGQSSEVDTLINDSSVHSFQSFDFKALLKLQKFKTKASKQLGKNVKAENTSDAIRLTKDILWQSHDVADNNLIRILGNVHIENGGGKAAVLLLELYDKEDNKLSSDKVSLPKSEYFGCNFIYLQDTKGSRAQIAYVETKTPIKRVRVGLAVFQTTAKTKALVSDFEVKANTLLAPAHSKKDEKPKLASDYKVAIIADEFTTNSFDGEFQALPIEPDNWLDVFEQHEPDVFFCESAWAGPDPVKRPWRGKVYASVNFKNENRKALLSILDYCKRVGIPTVFWNKEDPTHHNDRVHDFVKTASFFDYVFTTAEECVESYKVNYGVKNAHALPFATNPRLFNPQEEGDRTDHVVFAGSWYENHTERCKEMRQILDSLIESGFELDIYNRYHGDDDPFHVWPEEYSSYLLPAKPHNEMAGVYKSSLYGLNFNTVTDSTTMFARRVFELISSNTLVISNYSKGVDEMFGKLVVFPDKEPSRLQSLSLNEVNALRDSALHEVLEKHTYKQRWRTILSTVGLPYIETDITLTFVFVVSSKQQAVSAIAWYQQYGMQFKGSRLLLVVDESVEPLQVAKFYQEFNRFGVSVTSMLHAKKYALKEHYKPVQTSHFVTTPVGEQLKTSRIKRATLHLQYINQQFVSLTSNDSSSRYYTAPVDSTEAIIGESEQFLDWLLAKLESKKINAYMV